LTTSEKVLGWVRSRKKKSVKQRTQRRVRL